MRCPRPHTSRQTSSRFWRESNAIARHRKLVYADDAGSWEWEALQNQRTKRMALWTLRLHRMGFGSVSAVNKERGLPWRQTSRAAAGTKGVEEFKRSLVLVRLPV